MEKTMYTLDVSKWPWKQTENNIQSADGESVATVHTGLKSDNGPLVEKAPILLLIAQHARHLVEEFSDPAVGWPGFIGRQEAPFFCVTDETRDHIVALRKFLKEAGFKFTD